MAASRPSAKASRTRSRASSAPFVKAPRGRAASASSSPTKIHLEQRRAFAFDKDFMLTIDLKQMIREVPDFPKPGINFFDITTLLKDPNGLQATIDALASPYLGARVEVVGGI